MSTTAFHGWFEGLGIVLMIVGVNVSFGIFVGLLAMWIFGKEPDVSESSSEGHSPREAPWRKAA